MEEVVSFSDIEMIIDEVVKQILIPKFKKLGMDATGEWIRTIEARDNQIWGKDYTEFLVNGRRPGKMPPIAPIVNWVQAKFGMTGQAAISRAYAVARTIAAEGTTYYKKGGTDLLAVLESDETRDFINRRIEEVANDNIQEKILNEIKTRF